MCDSADSGGDFSGNDCHGSDSCQDLSQEHELSFTGAQRGFYFFASARPLTVMPSDVSILVHNEPWASKSVLRAYANAVEIAALHWHGGRAWLMVAIAERVPVLCAEIVEAAGGVVMGVQPAAKRRARGPGGAARRVRRLDQDRTD